MQCGKVLVVLCTLPAGLFAASWQEVKAIGPGQRVEIQAQDRQWTKGRLVRSTDSAIVVRGKTGEVSLERASIRRVKVEAPARRIRNSVIGVAAGAAVGLALGFAVCPGCANEGHGEKYTAPLAAAGAGVGTLAFLPRPYRTVFKN